MWKNHKSRDQKHTVPGSRWTMQSHILTYSGLIEENLWHLWFPSKKKTSCYIAPTAASSQRILLRLLRNRTHSNAGTPLSEPLHHTYLQKFWWWDRKVSTKLAKAVPSIVGGSPSTSMTCVLGEKNDDGQYYTVQHLYSLHHVTVCHSHLHTCEHMTIWHKDVSVLPDLGKRLHRSSCRLHFLHAGLLCFQKHLFISTVFVFGV